MALLCHTTDYGTTMGRGQRNRKKQHDNRAAARRGKFPLQQQVKTSSDQPTVALDDKAYKQLEQSKREALKEYIHSNNLHTSKHGLSLIRLEGRLPVIAICSSLRIPRNKAKDMTKICPSEAGLNLHHRSAIGLGLEPDESFEVRWDDADGQLIAMMKRNVFTPSEATACSIFEKEHVSKSKGWNRGCEADVLSRENTTRRQLKDKKITIGAIGINENNKLLKVGPGSWRERCNDWCETHLQK